MKRQLIILMVLFTTGLFAQVPTKKILTHDDMASWKTIEGTQLSNNGKYVAYELNPQWGDGKLIIKHLDSKQEDTIPRGYSAKFSPESNYVVFKIKQPIKAIRKAKKDKVDKEKMPKDSIGIFMLKTQKLTKFADLKSYAIPEENAGWIAFLSEIKENKDQKKDSIKTNNKADEKKKKKKNTKNDLLILYDAKDGDTLQFRHVTEYFYAKNGGSIAFIQELGDSITSTKVNIFKTSDASIHPVFIKEGSAAKVALDKPGVQYAFLFSADTIKEKVYSLYNGSLETGLSDLVIDKTSQGMPIGWAPSEFYNLNYSDDGTRLYFGNAVQPAAEPKDTLMPEEKAKVDVWNWKDKEIQPQQKVDLDKEKKKTYLAVLHLSDKQFIQLADPIIDEIRTIQKGNGKYALGLDDQPYKRESSWTGKQKSDYYLVDVKTGIKRLMVKGMEKVWLSPGGNFVVWYDPADSSYYSKPTILESISVNQLTKKIPVKFYNELNDTPEDPDPYGIAGWATDDRWIFIYDRFDIWKIDPTAMKVPVSATRSFGRRTNLTLRWVKLNPEDEFIDTESLNIAKSFDHKTKAGGFFKIDLKNYLEPRLLIAEDMVFEDLKKAKNDHTLIYTKQNCIEFPNLWTNKLEFERPRKISDANPQQKEFNWISSRLIKWTSFTGDTLEGILYMPENFNPEKKYPVIVYFYERNADNLHQHSIPSPSRSTVNRTFYASDGYIIFIPDITYRTGYPGQSAYDAIVSGTSYLINNYSFVDRTKIGLQGQSWGGYQTAYLITRTDMYAAAMAGAPVSNMTSAYGGIRWESGMSRMFQYEHSQSRIGGTLWDKPMQYIENSPLFYAPKVNTPLLMMSNDNDGAVPWYQGIEFFTALRRLDKPVWLLTYNEEPHNLKKESWGNRMDLNIRMKAFFDHYLKGSPAPEWMKNGIRAIDKGKKTGY